MRLQILLAITFMLNAVPLPAQQIKHEIKGNGYTILQRRSVSPFSKISVRDNLALYISQGDTMPLTIDADDNLFDYIITEVHGSTLNVQIEDTVELIHGKGTGVFLSTPQICEISANSKAKVVGSKVLQGDSLRVSSKNGSNVELNLNYKVVHIECDSTSHIKLRGDIDSIFIKQGSAPYIKMDKLSVNFSNNY